MRRTVLSLAACLLSLALAHPAVAQSEITWVCCGAQTGALHTFSCDNDTAMHVISLSFVAPAGVTEFVGIEARIDIKIAAPSIPLFWQIGPGGCRPGASFLSFEVADAADLWPPFFAGGTSFQPSAINPNEARLLLVAATSLPRPLTAGRRYEAVRIVIDSRAYTCAGCDIPACLMLVETRLAQSAGVGDFILSGTSSAIGWQCPALGPYTDADGVACETDHAGCAVPVDPTSWGRLKTLYR